MLKEWLDRKRGPLTSKAALIMCSFCLDLVDEGAGSASFD